jgi:hypothetical protein
VRLLGLAFALSLAGCSASFSNATPGQYSVPATRAASLLVKAASATKFVVASPATSVADIREVGGNQLLLDSVASVSDDFSVSRNCGPLSIVDGSTGATKWSHAREGACPNPILTLGTAYLLTENRPGKPPTTELTLVDRETGATKASTHAGRIVTVSVVGDDVVTLERAGKEMAIVARAGDSLKERWNVKLTKDESATKAGPEISVLSSAAGVVYGIGSSLVLALDAKSGQRLGTAKIVSEVPLVPSAISGGLLVMSAIGEGKQPSVTSIGAKGEVRWSSKGKALLYTDADVAVLASDQEVALAQTSDGAVRWSAKLPSTITGRAVLGDKSTVLVPHQKGVVALDLASGAPKFSVDARPGESPMRHVDQLIVEADGLVVWDTWRHLVAFDLTGKPRWSFDVRSLPLAHREGRSIAGDEKAIFRNIQYNSAAVFASAFSTAPSPNNGLTSNGGINVGALGLSGAMTVGTAQMSMAASDFANARGQANLNSIHGAIAVRRQGSVAVSQRLAIASAASPYVIRPITWNLGRGYLVVRKSDGAFAEVIVGPSDLYEEMWRESSAAAFLPDAKTLVTFSEGFTAQEWKLRETPPVKLVEQRLMGFSVDPASFKPASEYATASKVPDGSYVWLDDVRPPPK